MVEVISEAPTEINTNVMRKLGIARLDDLVKEAERQGFTFVQTDRRSMGGVEDGWIAHPCGLCVFLVVLRSLACKLQR